MKPPTLKQQVETFHLIMHAFNLAGIGGKQDHVRKIVDYMDRWSYAHRAGNGEPTDQEQRDAISRAFWRLDSIVRNP